MTDVPPFLWQMPSRISGPLIISVPHAGRYYPPEVTDRAVDVATLRRLEDRHCDALVDASVNAGFPVLVASVARAVVDLNRAESDMDPLAMADGHALRGMMVSAKARVGLGVIPTRLGGRVALWRAPVESAELHRRIADVHRPYHIALSSRISTTLERYGTAILMDLHSMPSLAHDADSPPVDIVIGDRFGRSAMSWVSDVAIRIARSHGLHGVLNSPYAGGYILERHARPAAGVQAIQVEIDRRLYLDDRGECLPQGVARMRGFVADLARALASEALNDRDRFLQAAE